LSASKVIHSHTYKESGLAQFLYWIWRRQDDWWIWVRFSAREDIFCSRYCTVCYAVWTLKQ